MTTKEMIETVIDDLDNGATDPESMSVLLTMALDQLTKECK